MIHTIRTLITDEKANWDSDVDGPTALAEFFGDFMVVNGKIWPKEKCTATTLSFASF